MRIAYISLHWPRTKDSGVGKKIGSQINSWREFGHDVCLFMHTSVYTRLSDLIPAEVIQYKITGKMRTELDRIRAAKQVITSVKRYRPDLIYLRMAMYVYPIHKLAEIAPIVGEINTNDIEQHKLLGKGLYFYNRITRGILLERVSGLISVSEEMAKCNLFTSYEKPIRVIPNGIKLSEIPLLEAPNNETPRIFFIGTPPYSWHGVDKLVKLSTCFPDLQIDIVGFDQIPGFTSPPSNVTLHGYLSQDSYQKIMADCDVAISTLALHRKSMEELSTLKTNEYLAYGLPVVLPYIDTGLKHVDSDFLLWIPNTEDNIETHGEAIRDFAYRMRGRRVDRKSIKTINQSQKEEERIRFFEEIIANRR